MSRANNYITEAQDATRELWNAINKLKTLRSEWTYQDYTNSLMADVTLTEHPTVEELSAVVNTTTTALESLLAAGHGTNITAVL